MSATKNNSTAPPSYETKARATLEVARRIHTLPKNATSSDFTPAEVKNLSEMLLSLMALKEEEEGMDNHAVLEALGKRHDSKGPPDHCAIQAKQPAAIDKRATRPSIVDPAESVTHAYEDAILNAFHTSKDAAQLQYEATRRHLAHRERMHKVADLKKFHDTFVLQTPVPRDLLGLLGKDQRDAKDASAADR